MNCDDCDIINQFIERIWTKEDYEYVKEYCEDMLEAIKEEEKKDQDQSIADMMIDNYFSGGLD